MQRAVKWYPPAYDIRVESIPIPSIEDPDDAVVKIQLAGLCGSDLHVYRGHEDVDASLVCGHEFIGTVVALGSSFSEAASTSSASRRPPLYSTLRVGDEVVSPFTVSCGECHFCRVGFTCRCVHSALFGIPTLPGGQAQYVRVPKAGGTLFRVSDIKSLSPETPLSHSSLLLLADILPTGVFAALQALQHAKMSPMLTGTVYPFSSFMPYDLQVTSAIDKTDQTVTFAIIGLGPVGVCTMVSLLDILQVLRARDGLEYRILAVDPLASRRQKMLDILAVIHDGAKLDNVLVSDIETSKSTINKWTDSIGCNAVLEVVGNSSALKLAFDLVRPFGSISSVGVHQDPPLPFIGRDVYNKNVSFDFGRCPVRAMFPIAARILLNHQVVFGGIGEKTSLIEKVVGFDDAVQSYEQFDKGLCGKVLFDPWRS